MKITSGELEIVGRLIQASSDPDRMVRILRGYGQSERQKAAREAVLSELEQVEAAIGVDNQITGRIPQYMGLARIIEIRKKYEAIPLTEEPTKQ